MVLINLRFLSKPALFIRSGILQDAVADITLPNSAFFARINHQTSNIPVFMKISVHKNP